MQAASKVRRRLSALERREAILDAALPLFARDGYDRASLSSMARATGVTKPVLYDHFASKGELYGTLLERESGLLLSELRPVLDPAERLDERLRHIAEIVLRFVRRRPDAARLLFRAPGGDEVARAAHERIRTGAHRAATAAILSDPAFEAKPGISRHASAELIAELHGAVLERIAAWALTHPSVSSRALATVFVDALWKGLR